MSEEPALQKTEGEHKQRVQQWQKLVQART